MRPTDGPAGIRNEGVRGRGRGTMLVVGNERAWRIDERQNVKAAVLGQSRG